MRVQNKCSVETTTLFSNTLQMRLHDKNSAFKTSGGRPMFRWRLQASRSWNREKAHSLVDEPSRPRIGAREMDRKCFRNGTEPDRHVQLQGRLSTARDFPDEEKQRLGKEKGNWSEYVAFMRKRM